VFDRLLELRFGGKLRIDSGKAGRDTVHQYLNSGFVLGAVQYGVERSMDCAAPL